MFESRQTAPAQAHDPPAEDLSGIDDALPDRECDIVMKGGITSGVIYPLAVHQLASRFRLVNIGGTSAGAIAAAAAAAAELGRRRRVEHGIPAGGFRRLAALPSELGTTLRSLFQPAPTTRPLFQVMLAATRAPARPAGTQPGERGKTFGGKIPRILWAVVVERLALFLAGLAAPIAVAAVALWTARPVGLAVALVTLLFATLIGAVAGLALAGWSLYRVLATEVPKNHFGICTGMGDDPPALTPWLSALLDELSGNTALPADERHPLTFGDLWGAQATGKQRALDERPQRTPSITELAAVQKLRVINLEVMTTDLSNGRPHRLPAATDGLSFCPVDMRCLFPEHVVTHMTDTSAQTRRQLAAGTTEAATCPDHAGEPLYHLPRMPDLPVVVAARMSLSFPLLISAVPLYRVDELQQDAPIVRCWFSDGGITSNFPVHFFDSLVPRRPTFGINLRTRVPDHPDEDVYLPPAFGRSQRTRWRPITNVTSFGSTILDTMQNWSDEGQMTLPGFSDRIVHVSLSADEGGMNVDMQPERIRSLSQRGQQAARTLTGDVPDDAPRFDWDEHRWTRYRTAMAKLEQALEQMAETYDEPGDLARFLAGFRPRHYVGERVDEWLRFNQAAIEELMAISRAWRQRQERYTDHAPEPNPDLRMTPRF